MSKYTDLIEEANDIKAQRKHNQELHQKERFQDFIARCREADFASDRRRRKRPIQFGLS